VTVLPDIRQGRWNVTPVILVHGTYAAPRPGHRQWYESGSDFCKALDAALVARGVPAQCWGTVDLTAANFSWSGQNDWISRREGAHKLRQLVRSLDGRCHIVAHSHGGNVALEALEMYPGFFHGSLTLLGTPLMLRKVRSWYFATIIYAVLGLTLAFGALRLSRKELVWTMVAGAALLVLTLVARYVSDFWGAVKFMDSPVSPSLRPLYINSDQDEAYRLLRAITESSDPLKRNKQERWGTRLSAVISRLWTEVTADQPPFSRRQAYIVATLVAVAIGAVSMTVVRLDGSRPYLYFVALATSSVLMVLAVHHSDVFHRGIHVSTILNCFIAFAIQLAKYPATQLGIELARRLAWPILKANALGLSGAPGSVNGVTIAMKPPERNWALDEFKALPEDLIARVSMDRQKSAQRAFSTALAKIWSSEWSPEGVREILAQLNHPDLIHSSYYQYLDHGWVLREIAENIASER
jgi:hypothetical protein